MENQNFSTELAVEKQSEDTPAYHIHKSDDPNLDNAQNQVVVYNPEKNGENEHSPFTASTEGWPKPYSYSSATERVLPSIGAFTVQCAKCFKWRLIPTKEKYEEIREHILQNPFVCETAREWKPDVSCDDPADISQDGSRLWAIDKPNIAQPPPGWQRLLRIRGQGSSKFADIYYATPSGKRLRSMVEIQKYLLEHPEYISAGVTMSQFSFQTPKPLQEDYVRKRSSRMTPQIDETNLRLQMPSEPAQVNPLSWIAPPVEHQEFQIPGQGITPYFESAILHPSGSPSKKRNRSTTNEEMHHSNPVGDHLPCIKLEEPQQPWHSAFTL